MEEETLFIARCKILDLRNIMKEEVEEIHIVQAKDPSEAADKIHSFYKIENESDCYKSYSIQYMKINRIIK